MMEWFGKSWGAPVNEMCRRCDTPVGDLCTVCEATIGADDTGLVLPFLGNADDPSTLAYHRACFMRLVIGRSGKWPYDS